MNEAQATNFANVSVNPLDVEKGLYEEVVVSGISLTKAAPRKLYMKIN